jgi:hypothetical protein
MAWASVSKVRYTSGRPCTLVVTKAVASRTSTIGRHHHGAEAVAALTHGPGQPVGGYPLLLGGREGAHLRLIDQNATPAALLQAPQHGVEQALGVAQGAALVAPRSAQKASRVGL